MPRVLIIAATHAIAERLAESLHIRPRCWVFATNIDRIRGYGRGMIAYVETDTFKSVRDGVDMLAYLNSAGAQVLRVSLDKLHGIVR